jgi:hypothetical protein
MTALRRYGFGRGRRWAEYLIDFLGNQNDEVFDMLDGPVTGNVLMGA